MHNDWQWKSGLTAITLGLEISTLYYQPCIDEKKKKNAISKEINWFYSS